MFKSITWSIFKNKADISPLGNCKQFEVTRLVLQLTWLIYDTLDIFTQWHFLPINPHRIFLTFFHFSNTPANPCEDKYGSDKLQPTLLYRGQKIHASEWGFPLNPSTSLPSSLTVPTRRTLERLWLSRHSDSLSFSGVWGVRCPRGMSQPAPVCSGLVKVLQKFVSN